MIIKDRIKKKREIWKSLKDIAKEKGITFNRMNKLVLAFGIEIKTKNKLEYMRKKDLKLIDFDTKRNLNKIIKNNSKEIEVLKIENIAKDVNGEDRLKLISRNGLIYMFVSYGIKVNYTARRTTLYRDIIRRVKWYRETFKIEPKPIQVDYGEDVEIVRFKNKMANSFKEKPPKGKKHSGQMNLFEM